MICRPADPRPKKDFDNSMFWIEIKVREEEVRGEMGRIQRQDIMIFVCCNKIFVYIHAPLAASLLLGTLQKRHRLANRLTIIVSRDRSVHSFRLRSRGKDLYWRDCRCRLDFGRFWMDFADRLGAREPFPHS